MKLGGDFRRRGSDFEPYLIYRYNFSYYLFDTADAAKAATPIEIMIWRLGPVM